MGLYLLGSAAGRFLLMVGLVVFLFLIFATGFAEGVQERTSELLKADAHHQQAHPTPKKTKGKGAGKITQASPARQPTPTRTSRRDIPADYQAAYHAAAGACPQLTWTLLAGIGRVESNHGKSQLPGVHSGQNFAGAAGPMQIGNGTGKAGNAWARYGDGNPAHIYLPGPAARAAARKLCADGVGTGRIRQAVFAYNCGRAYCSVSVGYVHDVFAYAAQYGNP